MDAYFDYIRQANEAKLNELRRQADEYRLARSLADQAKREKAKGSRSWFRLGQRAARRAAARPVAKPVRLPRPMTATDEDVRRIA